MPPGPARVSCRFVSPHEVTLNNRGGGRRGVVTIGIVSPLTPGECAERLAAAIDYEGVVSATGLYGSKPVAGRVAGHRVRLRKRIGYRNSFQTFLVGTLDPEGGGTVFRGTLGMHPLVRGFMAVWFGGVAVGCAAAAVAAVAAWAGGGAFPAGVAVPPLMAAFGLALVRLGRYLARGEAEFLADFLTAALVPRSERPDAEPGAAAGGGTRAFLDSWLQ